MWNCPPVWPVCTLLKTSFLIHKVRSIVNVNMKNVKKKERKKEWKAATVTLILYAQKIMIPETIIHELN